MIGGRSLGVNGQGADLVKIESHESTHIWHQNKMGWANFYGKTIKSYATDILRYGTINNLYRRHGTLEWQAEKAADYYIKHIY